MLKLIRFLLFGDWHNHQWEVYRRIEVLEKPDDKFPVYSKYVLRCSKCGKLKTFVDKT